jgi:dihydropteroate synthase
VSVDTWRPEVARRALAAGVTVLNAADGMQSDEMWRVAVEFDVPIVVPFLSGPDPRSMTLVEQDPVSTIIDFFEARLLQADRFGLRHRCILDPGTGFAPPNWPWEQRYVYQKRVYTNLDALRRFDLPLYIALPWKRTRQHDELRTGAPPRPGSRLGTSSGHRLTPHQPTRFERSLERPSGMDAAGWQQPIPIGRAALGCHL